MTVGIVVAPLTKIWEDKSGNCFWKENKNMHRRGALLQAVLFGGTVAIFATPVWSQEAPGEHRQPDRNLTRPGDNENIPGMHGQGTTELSKDDMLRVEQALKSKGYNPGKTDGVADDTTRAALRSFQKDKGLPITGMVDKRTADELGVRTAQSRSSTAPSGQYEPKSEGRSQGRDADQNVPRDTRSK